MTQQHTAVLRWAIPVDDQPHTLEAGPIVHVDCRDPQYLEVWTVEGEQPPWPRALIVVGTGQPWPWIERGWRHAGTGLSPALEAHPFPGRPYGQLVWHLLEQQP